MSLFDEAVDALRVWKADPVQMVRDLFRVEPDAWQARGLREWADPAPTKRIAFQACAGPGKSTELAWYAWNALLCYSDGERHPNGAAVSITGENLKNNLWKELALWRERSPVLQKAFEMTSERIFEREHPQTWFLSARSFAKSANLEAQGRTLSGLHASYVFALADETGDMPPAVLRSAEQIFANCQWGRIAQAGNPTSLEGALYQAAGNQSHLWTVIRITGDPDDPERSPRIPLDWVREQVALYGRDNPWVMSFILGKFPPGSINALLGPDEVRAAMARHLREPDYDFQQKRLGVDVARFGDDATVLFPRQGLAAFNPVEMRHAKTHEIAARIALAYQHWGFEQCLIDDTGGWAAGVIDQLGLAGIPVLPVNFSSKASDPRYFNLRSEMHFRAAEHVKKGGALPDVPGLVREATAPLYWFEGGKLRVEEKEQIKKRLGKSPDYWDAFVLTFALPELPGQMALPGQRGMQAGHAVSEYDPFATEPE